MSTKKYRGNKGGSKTRDTKNRRSRNDRSNTNFPRDKESHNDTNMNRDDHLSSLNDISWYTKYPDLAVAASQLQFVYKPGMHLNMGVYHDYSKGESFPQYNQVPIPGIMVLEWYPSVGRSADGNSPVNMVAREIYDRIRKAYSGTLSVDAPDLMIYLVSLDSIFSYIGALKRIYRILTSYTPYNFKLPDALLNALGFTPDTITNFHRDRKQLYSNINELVYMTRRFTCPAVFDYFNRHYWMNDNVYLDSDTEMGQMYIFRQRGFYKFNYSTDANNVKVGSLVMTEMPSVNDVNTLYNFGLSLIRAMTDEEDTMTISGYLARAYEGSPTFIVEELNEDEKLKLSYVPEVLSQIENSMTVNSWDNQFVPNSLNVTQDVSNNALIHEPQMQTLKSALSKEGFRRSNFTMRPFINIHSNNPSPAEVLIASRLTAYVELDTKGDTGTTPTPDYYNVICGTEIPVLWRYINNLGLSTVLQQVTVVNESGTADTSTINLMSYFAMAPFDWHPFIYFVQTQDTSNTTLNAQPILYGDIYNITSFSPDQLKQLHRICLFSEFNAFGQI
nr:capsid protein [Rat picobirnavirus]